MSAVDSVTAGTGLGLRWGIVTLILASCVTVFFHTNERPRGSNVRSRYATIDSLVHRDTYVIDKSRYADTIDKAKLGKHYYSSKPPVLPTLAAGVYYVLHEGTRLSLAKDERTVTLIINLFVGLVPHLFLLIYVSRFLSLWVTDRGAHLATLGVFGFAYLGAGYATDMNNHSPAAVALFVAFYYAYVARREQTGGLRNWLLCGLFAGLAPTLDLGAAIFCVGIFIYLAMHDWRKTLFYFIPASFPFLICHFYLTYVSTGSLLPIYVREGVGHSEGSYWLKPRGIDALDQPKHIYALHVLFGHHGLFAITPLFLLSCAGLYQALRDRRRRTEAAIIGMCAFVVCAFYIYKTHNYGGRCVGMRWFIFMMPLLLIFLATWIEHVKGRFYAVVLFGILFVLSQYNAMDAMRRPFKHSEWHKLLIDLGAAEKVTSRDISFTDALAEVNGTDRVGRERAR